MTKEQHLFTALSFSLYKTTQELTITITGITDIASYPHRLTLLRKQYRCGHTNREEVMQNEHMKRHILILLTDI